MPRALGGADEPANLITLCTGCHAAFHPNLQGRLSRRLMERWAWSLARWLDQSIPKVGEIAALGAALRFFGVAKLRDGQLPVVIAALQGRSILMISPTGSGKSLCFQLPALMSRGTSYVISPLKALMADQISKLTRAKIPASFINSDLDRQEKSIRYQLLAQGALKLLYCAPERFNPDLVNQEELDRITAVKPRYLVIDEAHCIDKWGGDFRPSYAQLGAVKAQLGHPAVLAFTASAGVRTQRRILQSLGLTNATVFVRGVDRPNIALCRLPLEDDEQRYDLLAMLLKLPMAGRCMIFVPTVRIGEAISAALMQRGHHVPFYHAKLRPSVREFLQKRFTGEMQPSCTAIICTNAFGMGLDIADVRLVLHWQHPASMEDYLQEFGRAGRDGAQSLALLLTRDKDVGLHDYMIRRTLENASLSEADKALAYREKRRALDDMNRTATERSACLRQRIHDYFVDPQATGPDSWALCILNWIFGTRSKQVKPQYCCDYCDRVTGKSLLQWMKTVIQPRQ